ncbi:LysR family transcriptional regulator [Nonomuraea sp. NPDC005501]|uniref:LysR family transcriptional regulator n=1 Tax=Nonomuraea sp. NPDC005501 TaxID=3156884 RepID=UPI0033A764F7
MSWSDLPPLGPLVAFEATVRHGSVSKAAAELHLTHGAVSRQIQQLERALGVTLFERRNRAVVPTPAARTFVQSVDDALNLLSAAARQARATTRPALLVLSCEPTLLMRWLIPRLPALTAAAPGLNLHLVASGGPVAFEREGIDVAIRRNDFDIPGGLTTFELFDESVGPVCTPELGHRLSRPEDLTRLPRLHTSTRPSAWADWAKNYPTPLPPAPEQTFEHFYLSLQAAASGLGVAIGPRALVHDDLEAGRLTAPLGFRPDGSTYLLMTPLPARDDRVTALVSWLREQAQGNT